MNDIDNSGENASSGKKAGGVFFKENHLMSERDMDHACLHMAKEIVGEYGASDDIVLIGIKTRGVPLADWIARHIDKMRGSSIKVGAIDINLYRDDLSEVDDQPIVKQSQLPFPIVGKGVILCDDVLYTGRTIRSALDALVDLGRPKFIKLAVMIDRGFRELPIHGDYIGKKINTTATQNVKVRFKETDGKNEVVVRG